MLLRFWTLWALLMGGVTCLPAAVLYSVTGLDTPGLCCTTAYGINNAGQITGSAGTASDVPHAFLYSNGVMMDLNSLIDPNLHITLINAYGINDNGQIVANSNSHAYLLTPVPEPGTWALLGAGLLLVATLARPYSQ